MLNEQELVELQEAAAQGMAIAFHAGRRPERMAVESEWGRRSFGELNANANRLGRLLRSSGVGRDCGVALLCRNRPEFCESWAAVTRIGGRLTPINWHLLPEEVAYIVADCEAKVLIAEDAFVAAVAAAQQASSHLRRTLMIGEVSEPSDQAESYATAIAEHEEGDVPDPIPGLGMLYTSGTTGHPKGVYRKTAPPPTPFQLAVRDSAALAPENDVSLVTGPLYHAAPLALNFGLTINAGVGSVLMNRWDAEETLRLIDRFRVTHTHMVATMFHRLLALPEAVRSGYDVASLRWVIHGAAPTPVHIKERIIEWLGPVVWEYYAATEGGSYYIGSEEWMDKKGSVGRAVAGTESRILDDDGAEVGQGEAGRVFFAAPPEGRFEYFKAPEKTAQAYDGDWYTMGDIGYHDQDGYLFLTGRSAETIISAGVNIYPQEIDDVLHQHPAVYEVCTVGVPSEEWGESVTSVVELQPEWQESDEVRADLLAFCEQHLPAYKRPRGIDFATDLPRMPTGKIQRHKVRAGYWVGHDKAI